MPLSVLIHTLNEEANIRACLESVSWADEIIVVDMHSDDKTVEIARNYTSNIYTHERMGYADPARNFAISKASHEWALFLDADERVTPALRDAIEAAINHPDGHVAFRIPFQDYMFGRWVYYGMWKEQRHVRLFKPDKCFWPTEVHQSAIINGDIGLLNEPILHLSHLTIGHFVNKMNRYTGIQAQEMYERGERKSLVTSFVRAFFKFWKEYLYRQGYKDGGHGFILAALMAIYYFMIRIKLWELWYKHDHNGEPLTQPPQPPKENG